MYLYHLLSVSQRIGLIPCRYVYLFLRQNLFSSGVEYQQQVSLPPQRAALHFYLSSIFKKWLLPSHLRSLGLSKKQSRLKALLVRSDRQLCSFCFSSLGFCCRSLKSPIVSLKFAGAIEIRSQRIVRRYRNLETCTHWSNSALFFLLFFAKSSPKVNKQSLQKFWRQISTHPWNAVYMYASTDAKAHAEFHPNFQISELHLQDNTRACIDSVQLQNVGIIATLYLSMTWLVKWFASVYVP